MNSTRPDLAAMLIRHEGLRLKPYRCPAGKLTIGCGRNLEDVGISRDEAMDLLCNDIAIHQAEMERFPWFAGLSGQRKNALIDMHFNLGDPAFRGFKRMIAALAAGDYNAAADEMLASAWARQVGARATELADMMRRG
ncbi:MAG: lysozyme [Pseudomonadota bacterium]|nr:lysozyme [Pseudomonadota bacterium]